MTGIRGYVWKQAVCVNGHRYQSGDMTDPDWAGGRCPQCHPERSIIKERSDMTEARILKARTQLVKDAQVAVDEATSELATLKRVLSELQRSLGKLMDQDEDWI